MKKLWLFVVVVATFVGFCGCEKEPVEPRGGKGGEEVLGGEKSNCLDIIFHSSNKLIHQNKDFDIYVINSLEELSTINSFECQPAIDWDKYTLVGGRISTEYIVNPDGIEISLDERNDDYLLNIALNWYGAGYTALDNAYFWRLYPKLKDNKNVTIEITKNFNGE